MKTSHQKALSESLQSFSKKIQELYETDIGDFKRKALTYLNRLEEEWNDPSLKAGFRQLKESLICNTTRDIEELRSQVSDRASRLKQKQ